MQTRPDITMPVLGHPLSGKCTFVQHAARAFGGHLRVAEAPVDLAGRAVEANVLRGAFEHAGRRVELWCMPRGSAPEWQTNLAQGAPVAILVAEPQATTFEHQAKFFESFAVLPSRWFVVVGKQDLSGLVTPPQEFLPAYLGSAPRLEYSGLAPDADKLVQHFLARVVLPLASPSAYDLDAAIAARHKGGAA